MTILYRLFKLAGTVQTLKRPKRLDGVRHIKAGAISLEEISGIAILGCYSESKFRISGLVRVFLCITKKVVERYLQQVLAVNPA